MERRCQTLGQGPHWNQGMGLGSGPGCRGTATSQTYPPQDAPVGRHVVADTVAGAASPGGLEKKKVCETQARLGER